MKNLQFEMFLLTQHEKTMTCTDNRDLLLVLIQIWTAFPLAWHLPAGVLCSKKTRTNRQDEQGSKQGQLA